MKANRIHQSDLSPRLEQLESILKQRRTIQEISRLMHVTIPTAKMYLSRLRQIRPVTTFFRYGSSTYQIQPTTQNDGQ